MHTSAAGAGRACPTRRRSKGSRWRSGNAGGRSGAGPRSNKSPADSQMRCPELDTINWPFAHLQRIEVTIRHDVGVVANVASQQHLGTAKVAGVALTGVLHVCNVYITLEYSPIGHEDNVWHTAGDHALWGVPGTPPVVPVACCRAWVSITKLPLPQESSKPICTVMSVTELTLHGPPHLTRRTGHGRGRRGRRARPCRRRS